MAPQRLSRRACAQIERADVAVSVISLWEMLVKRESGKLKLPAGDMPSLAFHLMSNDANFDMPGPPCEPP